MSNFNKLDDNELDSYKIQAYNYGEKNFSKLNLIKKLEILMEDLRWVYLKIKRY